MNAHIDDAGFVAHFPIECCELYVGEKGALGGLNSFGNSAREFSCAVLEHIKMLVF